MTKTYDVFVSYTHADQAWVKPLVTALREHELVVFFDESEIEKFARITTTISQSLAQSKTLLAFYSAKYPKRLACQWELTAAYLAASRQGDPAQRVLVVNPEQDKEHLYPQELRDALFSGAPAPDDTEALAALAETVARHVHGLTGTFGAVAPLTTPRWVPTQGTGSTRFVGRLVEMWKTHSALHPQASAVKAERTGPAVAQLRGLGGVGKSLLAEEYALRFSVAYPGGVFWLRAYASHDTGGVAATELEARRYDELRRIAVGLGLDVADRDPEQLLAMIAAQIEQRGQPCLWVVDDLPGGLPVDLVRGWLAPHPLAATLITTRSQTYGAIAAAVDVDVLDVDEAYELLTVRRPPAGQDEQDAAWGIVAELGCHALAVDVAGAGLRNQEGLISYTDFHARLRKPARDELELVAELADALPNGHEASIARTLVRSIEQLDEPGRDVLRLAAVLAAALIPARLVAAVIGQADGLDEARRCGGRGWGWSRRRRCRWQPKPGRIRREGGGRCTGWSRVPCASLSRSRGGWRSCVQPLLRCSARS